MSATTIQWTDFSVNPIRARSRSTGATGHYCQKISPGCANCYASTFQPRRHLPQFPGVGPVDPDIEIYLDEKALQGVLARKKPTKYFWCDMSDMFGSWVPFGMIDRCFDVMEKTPHHIHQILTKRPFAMANYLAKRECPPTNIWCGTSIENQKTTNRIDDLLACPAAVRFLSIEPLLERIALPPMDGVHWVIVGGESGHRARPVDVSWIKEIVAICKMRHIPCFVKQLGSNPVVISNGGASSLKLSDAKGGEMLEWEDDLRVREFPLVVT